MNQNIAIEEVKSTAISSKKCILYVEDDPDVAKTSEVMLKRFGYEVVVAMRADEAIRLFKVQPDNFDLVITDMGLPDMDGIELSKRLIVIKPAMPVILFTGSDVLIDEKLILKAGIQETISKPCSIEDLSNTIHRALGD